MNAININNSKEKATKELAALYKKMDFLAQQINICIYCDKPKKGLENRYDYVAQKIERLCSKNGI